MSTLWNRAAKQETRPQSSDRATMDWLVDDALVENAALSVARMTLAEDACSEGHRHPNCNEVIHLIAGRVGQAVGEDRVVMAPGDTVFIPAGAFHQSRNIGAGEAVMIVSYSSGTRIYEPAP